MITDFVHLIRPKQWAKSPCIYHSLAMTKRFSTAFMPYQQPKAPETLELMLVEEARNRLEEREIFLVKSLQKKKSCFPGLSSRRRLCLSMIN